jgi:polyhydroxyalkanoate synthesis regulator protein
MPVQYGGPLHAAGVFGRETMTTERLIKKYPNRRLYDTEESRYITLSEVGIW